MWSVKFLPRIKAMTVLDLEKYRRRKSMLCVDCGTELLESQVDSQLEENRCKPCGYTHYKKVYDKLLAEAKKLDW